MFFQEPFVLDLKPLQVDVFDIYLLLHLATSGINAKRWFIKLNKGEDVCAKVCTENKIEQRKITDLYITKY